MMCIWSFAMGLFIVVCLCFLLIVWVIWIWVWDDLWFDTYWLFIDCILYLIVWLWLMFCCNYVRWLAIMHIFLIIDCLLVAGFVCLCWFCLLFYVVCWSFWFSGLLLLVVFMLVAWLCDRLVYVVLFWIWCWLFMFVLLGWMVGCYAVGCCFDTCVLLFVVNCLLSVAANLVFLLLFAGCTWFGSLLLVCWFIVFILVYCLWFDLLMLFGNCLFVVYVIDNVCLDICRFAAFVVLVDSVVVVTWCFGCFVYFFVVVIACLVDWFELRLFSCCVV